MLAASVSGFAGRNTRMRMEFWCLGQSGQRAVPILCLFRAGGGDARSDGTWTGRTAQEAHETRDPGPNVSKTCQNEASLQRAGPKSHDTYEIVTVDAKMGVDDFAMVLVMAIVMADGGIRIAGWRWQVAGWNGWGMGG